jgi:hypothetical protein
MNECMKSYEPSTASNLSFDATNVTLPMDMAGQFFVRPASIDGEMSRPDHYEYGSCFLNVLGLRRFSPQHSWVRNACVELSMLAFARERITSDGLSRTDASHVQPVSSWSQILGSRTLKSIGTRVNEYFHRARKRSH